MDVSTTTKRTRVEQCQLNAKRRSEQKRKVARSALDALVREQRTITKAAVARRAGVSLVFLRSHPDLLQAIDEAANTRQAAASPVSPGDNAKDQVIAALRRRLEEMKQQLAAKDRELRGKQREIDRLYGKLAAASPHTDAELRRTLASALERLAQHEMDTAELRAMRRTPGAEHALLLPGQEQTRYSISAQTETVCVALVRHEASS